MHGFVIRFIHTYTGYNVFDVVIQSIYIHQKPLTHVYCTGFTIKQLYMLETVEKWHKHNYLELYTILYDLTLTSIWVSFQLSNMISISIWFMIQFVSVIYLLQKQIEPNLFIYKSWIDVFYFLVFLPSVMLNIMKFYRCRDWKLVPEISRSFQAFDHHRLLRSSLNTRKFEKVQTQSMTNSNYL